MGSWRDRGGPVARVELDAARAYPDANRANNVWQR